MANVKDREVFLLLEAYCYKRQRPRYWAQRPTQRRSANHIVPASSICLVNSRAQGSLDIDSAKSKHDSSPARTTVDRLVHITESAPVPEVGVENQDEIAQKLVELMISLGDDINQKIRQNAVLRQQLCSLNYDMFEKVTAGVQQLVDRSCGDSASEEQIQQQKIAWAFEVTSRLSAVGVVQRRRVLSFGDQYIQQHHSAWVQEHGGWDEVFAVD